nr:HAMP domain-containing sensor histidine kinase [Pseudohoeflea sp. DP4N28-3]
MQVICRTTGMGFAAVARVTDERWVACSVKDDIGFGLKVGGELPIETTFCNQIRQSGVEVVIDDVDNESDYRAHPIPQQYGFKSYISLPIRRQDGSFFGTLCAIDPDPARVRNAETIDMFKMFAAMISLQLDVGERVTRTERALVEERTVGKWREQFIAVLTHDLRNPLASFGAGTKMLGRMVEDPKGKQILSLMNGSVVRMGNLIDNVLDLARASFGGGINVEISEGQPLAPVLGQVVAELASTHPDHQIETAIDIDRPVPVDNQRIGQVLSNLLANALTHGDPAEPIRVEARADDSRFELAVSNAGAPIPEELRSNLFEPYFGTNSKGPQSGLGLGLYIASEIARAHGAELDLSSDDRETRFTFLLPIAD